MRQARREFIESHAGEPELLREVFGELSISARMESSKNSNLDFGSKSALSLPILPAG